MNEIIIKNKAIPINTLKAFCSSLRCIKIVSTRYDFMMANNRAATTVYSASSILVTPIDEKVRIKSANKMIK